MSHFTVNAQLSQSSGSKRIVGCLSICPFDPSLTLTYWRPGEAGASGCRHAEPCLSLDAVEGMVFHCSAWKGDGRVAKFSIYFDWQGVWYERAWHAKITVFQEPSVNGQALNASR
jgi:hypothetical protein